MKRSYVTLPRAWAFPKELHDFTLSKKELVSQFETSASLPTPEADSDTVLINLKNGTYEIGGNGETKLRPPRKKIS